MKTIPARSPHESPPSAAALPRRPAGGGFGSELRARLFADVAGRLRDQLVGTPPAPPPSATAASAAPRATAGPRALSTTRPTLQLQTTGEWANLTRSIGGQYLSGPQSEVFVRQIALESANFDADVIAGHRVSSAGAEGIAQLMPSSYPHVNRRDPVASLHAAAATMRANLLNYGGDMRKALAAYNAGPGRVAQAVGQHGANWELGLPAETQTYLRELMG